MRWIVTTGNTQLHTALFCLVDYAGYRVIASSLLPIGQKSLIYGSCDAGHTVACDASVAPCMRAAGEWLHLKPHLSAGREIYAPTDIEVHRGTDGRLWILDTARVFPPEAPPKYFQALLLSVNGSVVAMDLPSLKYEDSVESLVPAPHVKTPFLLGTVFSNKQEQELNVKASMIVGVEIFGDALVVPAGFKGRFLYNLLRFEFVQKWPKPLSSDAFSGFGRDNFSVHNLEVFEASHHLKASVLPRVVDLLDKGAPAAQLTGALLTRLLHERGLNLRLLGLIWSRSRNVAVKTVLMSEMVTRACKQLMRGAMRAAKTPLQLRVVVVNSLNLILGTSVAATSFWETVVQLQLRAKYGSYGEGNAMQS